MILNKYDLFEIGLYKYWYTTDLLCNKTNFEKYGDNPEHKVMQ